MRYDNIQQHIHDFGNGELRFRSTWEINYAFYLEWLKQNGEIKEWEYEPERYKFDVVEGNHTTTIGTYLPDFRITENDGKQWIAEIKGYKQGMRKIQRMRKYHPEIEVRLVEAKEYNALKKQVGKLLNWY